MATKSRETATCRMPDQIQVDSDELPRPLVWIHGSGGTRRKTLPPRQLKALAEASRLCRQIRDVPEWRHEVAAAWHSLAILLGKVIG